MERFKVFIGLEETVIDNWHNGMLVNASRVREFLAQQDSTYFTIFSFAIWKEEDKLDFEKRHRQWLEKALDGIVLNVLSVQEMAEADENVTGMSWKQLSDFVSIRGKMGAFINWVNYHEMDDCLLIDDLVPNISIIDHDKKRTTRFVKVKAL
jgi:hypothetical protein